MTYETMPNQPPILNQAIAQKKSSCPTCGGEMIQKSKTRLVVVGLCMIASVAFAFFFPLFWALGIILALTGIYLVVWATLGKALWCRNCKKFSLQPRADSIR